MFIVSGNFNDLLSGDACLGELCNHLEIPLFLHWQVEVVCDDFGPSAGAYS